MTESAERARHWDSVYQTRGPSEVSWYQAVPRVSTELIHDLGVPTDVGVIDVGGGESTLVDHLLTEGFDDLTVLDLSAVALAEGRRRLGEAPVRWIEADVLTWEPDRRYGLWHDRAVFHFLVTGEDRAAYLSTMWASTGPGSAVILATFSPDGPESCSGLPVQRYSPADLAQVLGEGIEVKVSRQEEHVTPARVIQSFTWVVGVRS